MPVLALVPEDSNYTAMEQVLAQGQGQAHMPLKEFGVVDIARALEREPAQALDESLLGLEQEQVLGVEDTILLLERVTAQSFLEMAIGAGGTSLTASLLARFVELVLY